MPQTRILVTSSPLTSQFADVLARLRDDGTKHLFRRLLEQALQDLINAELAAQIGAGRVGSSTQAAVGVVVSFSAAIQNQLLGGWALGYGSNGWPSRCVSGWTGEGALQ